MSRSVVAPVRAGYKQEVEEAGDLATLSRNVRQLEEELAVQLLERSARGTKLTDAGMLLYEHASRGIDALHEGELAVTSHQNVLKGGLRLSIPPSFEPWWELLAAFQREHPDIQVVVYTTERAVDLSMEGIDIALRIGPVVHESLVAKRLLRYRHVLVASPTLLERFGPPTSPDALFALPAAIWVRDANAHRPWRLGEREIEPTAVLAVNDYLHLRQRAIAGDVVTELPPFLAAEALRDGRLVALLPDHPFPEQEVSLLYQRQQHPSRVVRAYLDYCQRVVGRYPRDGMSASERGFSWAADGCGRPVDRGDPRRSRVPAYARPDGAKQRAGPVRPRQPCGISGTRSRRRVKCIESC